MLPELDRSVIQPAIFVNLSQVDGGIVRVTLVRALQDLFKKIDIVKFIRQAETFDADCQPGEGFLFYVAYRSPLVIHIGEILDPL